VVGDFFQSINCVCFHVNREEVKLELLLKIFLGLDRKNTSVHFLMKHIFGPLGSMTSFEEHESPENPFFFIVELLRGQTDVEGAGVQKCAVIVTFSAEVQRTRELRMCSSQRQSRRQRHQRRWYRRGRCVWYRQRGGGLASSCISCYSCTVRTARVVLMLFSETFCLSVSLWRWCCRYPKVSAMPWEVFGGNDIWRVEFSDGWV